MDESKGTVFFMGNKRNKASTRSERRRNRSKGFERAKHARRKTFRIGERRRADE